MLWYNENIKNGKNSNIKLEELYDKYNQFKTRFVF
jgi:hypothetical protein